MTGKGTNVSRRLLSPSTNGIGEELRDIRTLAPANTFLRAVVTHVLSDPSKFDDETVISFKQIVKNPNFIDNAPRNSIIARVISNGQDRRISTSVICYPFLPSHLSLPIKSGEQVFILFENPDIGGSLPYWLWKTSEPNHVEDANYTHADRKFDRELKQTASDKTEKSKKIIPSFPNGGNSENSYSLQEKDDYENIINEDPAYKNFTPEPVPRFTKRPGDFVIQGSNNTLIVLGENRSGNLEKSDTTSSSGAIDIVAGRGRFMSNDGEEPLNTAPRTIKNTRGNLETDKNPKQSNKKDNPDEGDPDFINDASRIYSSIKMNADDILNISDKLPKSFKDEIKISNDDNSCVIVKSDVVRIISRRDKDNNIDGSIIIMREGEPNERSGLFLMPDGNIILDGEIVYIGRQGGQGTGPGGSEPYIKYSKYKSQITSLIDEFTGFLQILASNFAVPVAAPGMPHPGLTATIPDITSRISKLSILKTKIDEAKSTRIFGE